MVWTHPKTDKNVKRAKSGVPRGTPAALAAQIRQLRDIVKQNR